MFALQKILLKNEMTATDWKKLLVNHISDKGFVFGIYIKFSKLNNKKANH